MSPPPMISTSVLMVGIPYDPVAIPVTIAALIIVALHLPYQ
jgi:hypothetical protein